MSLPSYLIVFKQLRDVIEINKEESKQESQDEITVNHVPRYQHDKVQDRLQQEICAHSKTRERHTQMSQELTRTKEELQQTQERLTFTACQVHILSQQIAREKKAYENSISEIQKNTQQENERNIKLSSTNIKLTKHCESRDGIVQVQARKIEELEAKLRKQEQFYTKKLTDTTVNLEQQKYMAGNCDRVIKSGDVYLGHYQSAK